MDAVKLFMAIPDRINFLQMGRYGKFSELTYRNHFENESFDWFSFNEHLVKEHLTGTRKAIAIEPSYIPKSGKKTPWLGYFWSGCAGDYYRTRFHLEFCFRDSKQYAGITNCQSTDFRKLAFHFNASLTAINLAKAACKSRGIPYSISSCKSMIHNAYMLERFV